MAARPSQRMHAGCSWLLGDVEDPYHRLVGSRYQGRLDQSQTMWLSKIRWFFLIFLFSFWICDVFCFFPKCCLYDSTYVQVSVFPCEWCFQEHTHTHTHIGFLNPDTKVQLFCWGLGWSAGFRAGKCKPPLCFMGEFRARREAVMFQCDILNAYE